MKIFRKHKTFSVLIQHGARAGRSFHKIPIFSNFKLVELYINTEEMFYIFYSITQKSINFPVYACHLGCRRQGVFTPPLFLDKPTVFNLKHTNFTILINPCCMLSVIDVPRSIATARPPEKFYLSTYCIIIS